MVDAARGVGVRPLFQPVVELADRGVVGYEALARWPAAPSLRPDVVFELADARGTVGELDEACRRAALTRAAAAQLSAQHLLFVNTELNGVAPSADSWSRGLPADLRAQPVLELTERSLFLHPKDLVSRVADARAGGWRIALDDLGADPDTVALLDLVMPDVIKLDTSLLSRTPQFAQARDLAAVMAHSERADAVVLAEGIESAEHIEQALACGASLGQGYLFGRPAELPDGPTAAPRPVLHRWSAPIPATPYELVAAHPGRRVGSKQLLLAFSRMIEDQAGRGVETPIVLAAMQELARFAGETRRRYEELARRSSLVAVLGAGQAVGADQVRVARLPDADPLLEEWTVVALGADTAVGLIAKDLGDGGEDLERSFEFVLTFDRFVVAQAARCLMRQIA